MAYKICSKTTQKNKDCKLREEDDIAKIVNNTKVESFDIKQEWLDDMSSKLDVYNSQMNSSKRWWLPLLLIPVVALPTFLIGDTNDNAKVLSENNVIIKTEPNKSLSDNNTFHEKRSILRPSQEDKVVDVENRNLKKLKLDLEIPHNQKSSNDATSLFTATIPKNHLKKPVDPNVQIVSNKPALEPEKQLMPSNEVKSDVAINNTPSLPATSEVDKHQIEQTKIETKPVNFEENVLTSNSEKIDLEKVDTNLLEHTKSIPEEPEIIAEEPVVEEKQVLQDSNQTQNDAEQLIEDIDNEDKIEEEDIKIDSEGSKDKLWMIGFTLGPDFLTKEVTSGSDSINLKQINEEELIDNTWGYNFELSRQLTPWLTLGTGIGFKKYQEVNSYSPETFVTSDTSYIITDISYMYKDSTLADSVLIPNFLTVPKISKDTIIDSSKEAANGTVTSSYIQFPINAQVNFIHTKKLTAYTSFDFTIGILTKNTGMVLDYATNDIITYTSRQMIYNSSVGLGLNYKLFGPLHYKLFGAYQINLSNLSVVPNIDKRYNGFSFRTGLVFQF